jgi:excisionase family DNA binding protein
MNTPEKLLLRVPEAAEALGCSRAKAYELIASGEIPSIKIAGLVRVPLEGLREEMKKRLAEREDVKTRVAASDTRENRARDTARSGKRQKPTRD